MRLQSYNKICISPNFTQIFNLSASKSQGGKMYHPGSKSAANREKRQERARTPLVVYYLRK